MKMEWEGKSSYSIQNLKYANERTKTLSPRLALDVAYSFQLSDLSYPAHGNEPG